MKNLNHAKVWKLNNTKPGPQEYVKNPQHYNNKQNSAKNNPYSHVPSRYLLTKKELQAVKTKKITNKKQSILPTKAYDYLSSNNSKINNKIPVFTTSQNSNYITQKLLSSRESEYSKIKNLTKNTLAKNINNTRNNRAFHYTKLQKIPQSNHYLQNRKQNVILPSTAKDNLRIDTNVVSIKITKENQSRNDINIKDGGEASHFSDFNNMCITNDKKPIVPKLDLSMIKRCNNDIYNKNIISENYSNYSSSSSINYMEMEDLESLQTKIAKRKKQLEGSSSQTNDTIAIDKINPLHINKARNVNLKQNLRKKLSI